MHLDKHLPLSGEYIPGTKYCCITILYYCVIAADFPCPLEAVPGDDSKFIDLHTYEVLECGAETVYSAEDCACVAGGMFVFVSEYSCGKHIQFHEILSKDVKGHKKYISCDLIDQCMY